ncbi:hypothetical protein BDY24DRAFT_412454 [Mrakia frigida]|uniref:uncharacterized protein n=1 Tax=Mrakia frigida TaxID=29902 RepID=UPI003FCC1E07
MRLAPLLLRSPLLPFSALLSSLFTLSFLCFPSTDVNSFLPSADPTSFDAIPVLKAFSSSSRLEASDSEQIILDGASWRAQLEQEDEHGIGESRTLGFDRIVTLSLPGNEGTRGLHMGILSEALELDIDFLPSTPSSSPIVTWIAERVLSDFLFRSSSSSSSTGTPTPPYLFETPSPLYENTPWPLYLETYDPTTEPERFVLTGEHGDEEEIWKRLVKEVGKQGELDEFTVGGLKGMIACWHAHIRALLWIERTEGVGSALILEDDIDMEWDVKRLWGGMSMQLPQNWDIIYFGYVWSQENPPSGEAPIAIRRSSGPLGGMAYAVSKAGASQILQQLRQGSVYSEGELAGVGPFGQPWDNAMRALISMSFLSSYSVSPPLVVHPGLFSSNIGVGGSNWNGTLMDSTVQREAWDFQEDDEQSQERSKQSRLS